MLERCVLRGSFLLLGGLFFPPFSLGLFVFFELGRDAAGFNNSAACTHAPATFTFAASALRLGAEVLDLAPLVWTRGSELDLDPKSGALGKHWVQHQDTQNSCRLQRGLAQCPGVGRSRP